jgi:Zn-dependent protease with chaperone function
VRFRDQQDETRQATLRLLALFALLLTALVLVVNAALFALWWGGTALLLRSPDFFGLPPLFFETNTAIVLLFVLGGCWVETARLRGGGGTHVAEWAGGRELLDPRDVTERRLLNIVDEMALASGLPRPRVYLLEREHAINAFAAGWSPQESVVAVTRGALQRLTRDELQGLVAHEFGHIHNGDLRLHMVLLALVWGLSLVHGYGRRLFDTDEEGHHSFPGVLIGPVFIAAGSLGWVAGQVLQAAVSRQRELLADASAVQFTRSRDGLGGTLRKIWHQVDEHEAALLRVPSRLMAGQLMQAPAGWLSTHPPLPERVRRVYGRTMAPLAAPTLPVDETGEPRHGPAAAPPPPILSPIAYAVPMPETPDAGGTLPQPRPTSDDDEREAIDRLGRVHGPGEMRAVLLALIATPGSQRERRAWRDETKGLSTADALRDEVKKLSAAARLPWLEVLLGRLARAPLHDRQDVVEAARRVMAADGQVRPIDRLHWLALRHRLGEARPPSPNASASNDLADLSESALMQVARLTAFLSRLVPDGELESGAAWYQSVMKRWVRGAIVPAPELPDADEVAHALGVVQALPWMLRPVLVRAWLEAALAASPMNRLSDGAADALRLAGLLLDSPMPPELARHYVELPAALVSAISSGT